MATVTEQEAVVATVLDYFEGWFDGDVERMDRALHPALAKHSFELKRTVTKEQMVAWTAEGEGKSLVRTDEGWKIVNALWHHT